MLFDDDHYYLGGVLAELLLAEGSAVTIVTPAPRVSEWAVNTMEQERVQRRLLEAGAELATSHTLLGTHMDAARIACTYTGREREIPCDALVLVTARLPVDSLAEELALRSDEWGDAGVVSVRAVGDALGPGTIAAAVWDGRRYAEELDEPSEPDAVPFRREVVRLAPAVRESPAPA